jgi:SOS response regulatory protein OraA/RecX
MEGNAYDEESVVVELVNKKYLTKLSAENGALKVMQALLRKGFSMSAVRKALQKITGDDTVWM